MTNYSVFGPTTYYGTADVSNAGEPIELGNGFQCSTAGFCAGMRLWVPTADVGDLEVTFTQRAYATPDYSTTPLATVTGALGDGEWVDNFFAEPIVMDANDPIWLTYQFGITQRFISSGDGPGGAVLSTEFPALSLLSPGGGRSYFRASGGATTLSAGGPMYGIDIIWSDGTPPKEAVIFTATRLTGDTSALLEGTAPDDAPDGLTIYRAPGLHTTDGLGRAYGNPLYDPLTIPDIEMIAEGGSFPYTDTGLTPDEDVTYAIIRTGPGA